MLKAVCAGIVVLSFAGCGGAATRASFSQFLSVSSEVDAKSASFVETVDVPTTGSATYEGYVAVFEFDDVLDDQLDYLAVSELSFELDFADGIPTGGASTFFEVDIASVDFEDEASFDSASGVAIAGQMTITEGTQPVGRILLTGDLVKTSGERARYEMEVTSASYLGPNANEVIFEGLGTSTAAGRAGNVAGFTGDALMRE